MPAKDKAHLIAVTHAEFDKLTKQLAGVTTYNANLKDQDGISIKDIIAHRAHWIGLFLGWYEDGQAEREVHFPAKGFKWNQLPAYNAALRATQIDLGWSEACNYLGNQHIRLITLLESLSDTQLYSAPMKGAQNAWTTGRWAEASGASHYRSATKYIRARLHDMDRDCAAIG